MITDIFYFTGFGLIAPIVAIFIKEDLTGGTIFAAGIATTLFILVKSVVQLPFSKYVDKHDNKLLWLKIGYGLIIFNPFIYLLADHINYIYLAEVIHGIGSGIAFPAWLGLWSTHLDKGHESFEWSLYSTVVGLGAAATAGIGAAMAQYLGFTVTFLFVGIMAICSFITLFFLEKKVENPKKSSAKQYHIRRKTVNNHTFK